MSEFSQLISTKAPPLVDLENSMIAFFLSNKVFPINVPNPKPDLDFNFLDLEEI